MKKLIKYDTIGISLKEKRRKKMNIPAIFKLERRSILPVITVTGVADPLPGMDMLLILKAVEFIDVALKYNGAPMLISEREDMMVGIPKGKTAVKFNIIFRNEEEFAKGVEGLQKELG